MIEERGEISGKLFRLFQTRAQTLSQLCRRARKRSATGREQQHTDRFCVGDLHAFGILGPIVVRQRGQCLGFVCQVLQARRQQHVIVYNAH